jgi:hypothetical protein
MAAYPRRAEEADMANQVMQSAFNTVLTASGPSSEIPENSRLYAWLVGSWEADVFDYERDGSRHVSKGEWHFAWVLEGRAIQDVWIVPPRGARKSDQPPSRRNRYGTTIRVYDPKIDAWQITWINPVTRAQAMQIGRKRGDNIVQEGRNADETLTRWTFSEIQENSFRWSGETSSDAGETWFLHSEFRLRRSS